MQPIKIYTAKNCPYSKQLKDFLYENEIPFNEIKADLNLKNAQELERVDKNLSTPVTKILMGKEEKLLVGWNEETKNSLQNLWQNQNQS